MLTYSVLLAILAAQGVVGLCYNPSPAFPVPSWSKDDYEFDVEVLWPLEEQLAELFARPRYNISSASIELTSSTETLWSYHHTAPVQNKTRSLGRKVDGDSQYRIASITKAFTVLAILKQHIAGNLSIEDPVNKYIPEFKDHGHLPWKDITIRALASQLSGIPREFGQSDFLSASLSPESYGLPPASQDTLPPCFRRSDNHSACTTDELLEYANTYQPLFAPNQQSTYSNLNYEILGVVIENVSGLKYDDYIEQEIFTPLKMSQSSLKKPTDKYAVIPDTTNYWDVDIGSLSPTGGIYSSSSDLSKFLRYVLTHYNGLVTGVNWLHPASFAGGLNSFTGMPWEMFRTDRILRNTKRPVTFINKSGGVPAYFSVISVLPEYGLGVNILVAGQLELLDEIIEVLSTEIVRAAESFVWLSIESTYTGSYGTDKLNSSVVLETTPRHGIEVKSWISNGTDVLQRFAARMGATAPDRPWHMQLMPTLLYKNETSQQGEIFRMLYVPERLQYGPDKIWDSFCITDVDEPGTYAGLPMNEFVFWHEKGELELPAWRVTLKLDKNAADRGDGQQPLGI